MKPQHHIKKRSTLVQQTDGSVFKLNFFSRLQVLKLSIDTKSNILWKCFLMDAHINKNYKALFLKKFNYFKSGN
jgi:hypothetical protein